MNPYFIIAALISVGVLTGLAGWGGYTAGVDHEKSNQIDKQALVAEAVDAANTVAAQAIAKLAPKHSTIRQVLEKEIHENTVYVDCKSSQTAVDAFNSGIDGMPKPDGKAANTNPAGGIKLPGTNANP